MHCRKKDENTEMVLNRIDTVLVTLKLKIILKKLKRKLAGQRSGFLTCKTYSTFLVMPS